MRILQVHNKHRPGWGGEETVADLEQDLLRRNGHEVERLSVWTGELDGASPLKLLGAGFDTVWSHRGYQATQKAIARFCPDIVHVHNEFPLLSPSIFWAANNAGVPAVQTLHNYRLACADAVLLRDEKTCEECVGHFPWSALRHRCYEDSFSRTLAVTGKNIIHRWLGTYRRKVQGYIALSEFSKEIFVRAGLPRERVFVKPNFIPESREFVTSRTERILFVGWMSRLKGLHLLLPAWERLGPVGCQLMLVGDGPERAHLERQYGASANVVWCGFQRREKVLELMAESRWLIQPSIAYENCPMSVIEAFSVGTPVIVPNHGAFTNIVSDGQEGLWFEPGDAKSLETTLRRATSLPRTSWVERSEAARKKFSLEYTDRVSYTNLFSIYEQVIQRFQAEQGHADIVSVSTVVEPAEGSHKGRS